MTSSPFSSADRKTLSERGITEAQLLSQMETFEHGIPFTVLDRPCTVNDGIVSLQSEELKRLSRVFTSALRDGRAMKFVPASGAASRMFQVLLTFMNQLERLHDAHDGSVDADTEAQEFLHCMTNLRQFAFYDDLKRIMQKNGYDLDRLSAQRRYSPILEHLLSPTGLNYANLPKALLKFHRYTDHCRTPLEEHLVEAAAYTRDRHGTARLHFTVTSAHQEAFCDYLENVRPRYETSGTCFEVAFSTQKPSTDTLAVDLQNRPFRDRHGQLLFRPGGHGALLANLQETNGDIVFVKNVDNVVPDRFKTETYRYKKALGGHLIDIQNRIFDYLRKIVATEEDESLISDMFSFARNTLSIVPPPDTHRQSLVQKRQYLLHALNRPLRVCGMVRNVGEPGGGPFWVQQTDGTLSLQIVEISQVNMRDRQQRDVVANATHFNPVDLVCGLRDYRGMPFDLQRYTDPNAGFIATKSYEGRELKALELPGLWNGAMAKWNTVFVEVPLGTFNPVKSVLDLLRPQHHA